MGAPQSGQNEKHKFDLFPWIGYLIAVGSLLIQFFLWWGRQPALELRVSEMGFSSTNRSRAIPEKLARIEATHGAITGFRIGRLREAALTVEWSDSEQVEEFANALQREIKFYDGRIESPLAKPVVCYANGVVIWRDCELFQGKDGKPLPCSKWLESDFHRMSEDGARDDAVNVRGRAYGNCEYFRIDAELTADVYFPKAEVEVVRRNPSLAGEPSGIKEKILEVAKQLYHPGTAGRAPSEREEIGRELRGIRQILVDFRQRINDQLIVTLAVQNKSRTPNYLLKDSLARICRQEGECRDVELEVQNTEQLEGASVAWVIAESKPLTPSAVEFIRQAIKRRYPVVTVVRDVHDNVWHTKVTPAELIYTERTKEELSASARDAFLDEVF